MVESASASVYVSVSLRTFSVPSARFIIVSPAFTTQTAAFVEQVTSTPFNTSDTVSVSEEYTYI